MLDEMAKTHKKQAKKNVVKKRGLLLTMLLFLALVGIALTGFSLLYKFSSGYHSASLNLPFWYPIYEIMGVILSIGMVYGIWMYRKWGVFLLIIRFIVALIFDLVIVAGLNTLSPSFIMATAIGEIIFILLWYAALKPRWSYFR